MTITNRIVRSQPVDDAYSNGTAGGRQLAGLLDASAGAGMVLTDLLAVSPEARISSGSAGIYTDKQATEWSRIVDRLHEQTDAMAGASIGHAGPRAATRPRHEGVDRPLHDEKWTLMAVTDRPYSPHSHVPKMMDRCDMAGVRDCFRAAAIRALDARFDLLELDFSHGYLLAGFLSPLTNRRSDEYGRTLENRLRYPLEVLDDVRAIWPAHKPLSVKFSVSDWSPQGLTETDAIASARAFTRRGSTLLHVVSGQTTWRANPSYTRGWEAQLADAIRNEADARVLLGGYITTPDEVNTLLVAGRADLCLVSNWIGDGR